ncbi:MAG: hypothetical protein SWH68_17375, partial [Thermodesulfobacteriota bacterium]|nr:hypothetical protein [Thermodesulfobacteriota bacterium]
MNRVSYGRNRKFTLAIVVLSHLVFFIFSTSVFGAALSKEAVRQTIKETMETVLTGQSVTPELKQKIETIKTMVA